MKLPVIITQGQDGYLVAEIPVLPGCISQGKTEEDTLANIKAAADLCLKSQVEEGWSLSLNYTVGQVEVDTPEPVALDLGEAPQREHRIISGTEFIAILKRLNYQIARTEGIHVRLRCFGRRPITVPTYRELDRRLLWAILRTVDYY